MAYCERKGREENEAIVATWKNNMMWYCNKYVFLNSNNLVIK
jgi:hypothetical protein